MGGGVVNTPMSDNLEGCVCVVTAEGGMYIQRNNILSHSVTVCGHGLLARLFFDSATLENNWVFVCEP